MIAIQQRESTMKQGTDLDANLSQLAGIVAASATLAVIRFDERLTYARRTAPTVSDYSTPVKADAVGVLCIN